MWRLGFDPVGGILKPLKPLFATSQAITLRTGKPVKVAWRDV